MKGYWYFFGMERGDSYLSSSTKTIRIGGLIAKIYGGVEPPPPFGRHVTKKGSGRRGLIGVQKKLLSADLQKQNRINLIHMKLTTYLIHNKWVTIKAGR